MITIFLADDHTIVRDGLQSLLRAQPDLEVIGDAENGREALQQMAQQCPDVAILDISMPELNGIETTRQLRELCPTTQVIILSMHASSGYIFRALQAGARGYLLKAAAGREVADAVRTVAAGRRYLGQEISDTVIDDYLHQPETAREQDPLNLLSPREREIFQLVVEGKSSPEIAEVLFISPKTVDTYRSRLMQKLNISDLPSLVKFAIRHGLASLE
jgi:DNA-binding NarL/FixJ family response regulator